MTTTVDWIPVATRPPEDRRRLLVTQVRYLCGVELPKRHVDIGHIMTKDKWSCESSFFVGFSRVTHWAELPEPSPGKPR